MDEFEEIVSQLGGQDYEVVYAPVAKNATISVNESYEGHMPGCSCEKRMLVVSFIFVDPQKEQAHIAIPVESALGHALLTEQFRERCQKRLDDYS